MSDNTRANARYIGILEVAKNPNPRGRHHPGLKTLFASYPTTVTHYQPFAYRLAGCPDMSPSAITPPASPDDSETEKVNLLRIAHVYYTHAGFEHEHQFLQDFGFTEVSRVNVGKPNERIYYRGYGTEPFLYCSTKGEEDAFGGTAFVVESRKDLELATRVIPTASEIWEMKDAPGGGECVTVKDPVDGFMVHLVYGQVQRELEEQHEQRVFNFVGCSLTH